MVVRDKLGMAAVHYKCDHCIFVTHSSRAFENHIRAHPDYRPFKCDHKGCDKMFTRIGLQRDHRNTHKCEGGSVTKTTKSKNSLKPARKVDSSILNKRSRFRREKGEGFECEQCSFKTCSATALAKHAKDHHPGFRPFKCDFEGCGQKFMAETTLQRHKTSRHGGILPYKCCFPGCDKRFKKIPTGNFHYKKVHLSISNLRTENNESLALASNLEGDDAPSGFVPSAVESGTQMVVRDMSAVAPTPYSCDHCPLVTHSGRDFENHLHAHPGYRPFKCDYEGCDKTFTRIGIRKNHINTHTGKKTIKCGYEGCSEMFSLQKDRFLHTKANHGPSAAKRKIFCTFGGCTMKFMTQADLSRHSRVHRANDPNQIIDDDATDTESADINYDDAITAPSS